MANPKNDEILTMDIDEVLKDSGIDYQVLRENNTEDKEVNKKDKND
jgi:hypothetical protein